MKKNVYFYDRTGLNERPSEYLDGTYGPYMLDHGEGPYIDVYHELNEAPFDTINVWHYEAGKRYSRTEIENTINEWYDDWFARP